VQRALTPAALILPLLVPLPLPLHIPAQLLLLQGLFRASPDLCGMRMASADLPAMVEAMVEIVRQAAPHLSGAFQSFPGHRCELVLSLGQVAG
jgi:hypothetical protein